MRDQNDNETVVSFPMPEQPEDDNDDHTEDPAGTFVLCIERAHVGALDEMANVVSRVLSGEHEVDLHTSLSLFSTFAHLRSAAALASIANMLIENVASIEVHLENIASALNEEK